MGKFRFGTFNNLFDGFKDAAAEFPDRFLPVKGKPRIELVPLPVADLLDLPLDLHSPGGDKRRELLLKRFPQDLKLSFIFLPDRPLESLERFPAVFSNPFADHRRELFRQAEGSS